MAQITFAFLMIVCGVFLAQALVSAFGLPLVVILGGTAGFVGILGVAAAFAGSTPRRF